MVAGSGGKVVVWSVGDGGDMARWPSMVRLRAEPGKDAVRVLVVGW